MASGSAGSGRAARPGLGIRHRCLSRLRLTVRAGAQRREREAEAERAPAPCHGLKGSLQNFLHKTKEGREKALKGALSTSLALTQVVAGGSAALANGPAMLQLQDEGQLQVQQQQEASAFAQGSLVAPSVKADEATEAPAKEVDLYRDTLVRYAGYANEVGESFKNLVSTSAYRMSYAIAICYVLADATDKGLKAENVRSPQPSLPSLSLPIPKRRKSHLSSAREMQAARRAVPFPVLFSKLPRRFECGSGIPERRLTLTFVFFLRLRLRRRRVSLHQGCRRGRRTRSSMSRSRRRTRWCGKGSPA